jgi:hypothetical protein
MDKREVDKLRKVCKLVGMAILETPRNGAASGKVRRGLLNQIEDALIEAGYDMVAARAKYNAATKADRDARVAKRDADSIAKVPPGSRIQVSLYSRATERRLEKGTVVAPAKKDMVMVRWDEGEPSLISAHHLELV